jgi:sirohydrochlorin cobaltochelatase
MGGDKGSPAAALAAAAGARHDGAMDTNPPAPGLLLIAHGTRNPAGPAEMAELVARLEERHPGPVGHAWLEDYAEPDAPTAAAALVAAGAPALVTVPFLVLGAGHAKTDVPEAVAAVRAAVPGTAVAHARVLDLHADLFALARIRVAGARAAAWGGGAVPADEALLVTGAGSSDPDANGDLAKAARFLAETTGHRWVDIAYAGVTWPTADDALRRLHAAGARRVVRFSWSLLAGLLERRIEAWAEAVAAETGLDIADAGRFGPDPLVAGAVLDRVREAVAGDARMNCDLCQYRLPLPGREERAGAPSAGGTGERVLPEARALQER